MAPERQPKRRCSAISDNLKRQICEWVEVNKNKTHLEVAKYFSEKHPNLSIERNTVSKILLQKEKWKTKLNTENSIKAFKHKPVKFPVLDRAMNIWVGNVTEGGVILTDLLIKEKARIFATSLSIQESQISFSNGWLEKFKK